MTDKQTGGPAFPLHNHGAQTLGLHVTGMTLRDYFAAKAMQAIIAGNITGQKIEDRSWLEADQWAPHISYEIADAMLRARNGKP
jgi:hypothetical protein